MPEIERLITDFFEYSLLLPLRPPQAWGVEDPQLIILRIQHDEYLNEDGTEVAVLSPGDENHGANGQAKLRGGHVKALWQGAKAGYAVKSNDERPDGERYRTDVVHAIDRLWQLDSGVIAAVLTEEIPISQLRDHAQSFRPLPSEEDFPGFPLSAQKNERKFGRRAIREEQDKFRALVDEACGNRCVLSGCDIRATLEAAHIKNRCWSAGHNQAGDGLLLRKDLHGLYDAGLLSIDSSGRVLIAPEARGAYKDFHDKTFEMPAIVHSALKAAFSLT